MFDRWPIEPFNPARGPRAADSFADGRARRDATRGAALRGPI